MEFLVCGWIIEDYQMKEWCIKNNIDIELYINKTNLYKHIIPPSLQFIKVKIQGVHKWGLHIRLNGSFESISSLSPFLLFTYKEFLFSITKHTLEPFCYAVII